MKMLVVIIHGGANPDFFVNVSYFAEVKVGGCGRSLGG